MAARLSPQHDAATRAKIQTSQLVNRLNQIAIGKVKGDPVAVKAAEILLRKSLPDLATIKHEGDADKPVAIRHTYEWLNSSSDTSSDTSPENSSSPSTPEPSDGQSE